MRNLIGKIIFWFIKTRLEIWNLKHAKKRQQFYKSMIKAENKKAPNQ
jgi:hypothetical protein